MCHCCCGNPWHAGYPLMWGGRPWAPWAGPPGRSDRPERKDWLEAYKKDLQAKLAEVEDELARAQT
jgi:hypothetical protein